MTKPFSQICFICGIVPLIALVLTGCNYTRLARSERKPIGHAELPDLAVRGVSTTITPVQYMDAPEEQLHVTITVHIQNIGRAPIVGTLFIGWIDRLDRSTSAGRFDHVGPFKPCTLSPGDSVDLTESWSYPLDQPSTPVELVLLTDTRSISQNDAPLYNCGAFPVQEERYDNNEWSTVVRSDTIKNQ